MKISEYRDGYYKFSGQLSSLIRQLAFAGIALIWIFRKGEESVESIDQNLYFPAVMIVIALAFDLFQYAYQTLVWACYYSFYYRYKKKKLNDEINSSFLWNIPTWTLFGLKVLFVIIAYWSILNYLMKKLII